jgi:hypothetical protein
MAPKKERKLKIYSSYKANKVLPELRISGLWLQEHGFNIGDLVQVTPGKEELTIKVIEKWK